MIQRKRHERHAASLFYKSRNYKKKYKKVRKNEYIREKVSIYDKKN